MTYLAAAAELDLHDLPLQAAWAYELGLREHDVAASDFINLIALYFLCADAGYAAHHHLGDLFVQKSEDRFFELIAEAERVVGPNAEITFWRDYYAYIHHGAEPIEQVCQDLVLRSGSLVPYMYLYAFVDRERFAQQARRLHDEIQGGRTVRERYLKSVLESHAVTARGRI